MSITIAVKVYGLYSEGGLSEDLLIWGLVWEVLLLATGLTDGVVSLDRPAHRLFAWLHNILPYAAILTLSVFIRRFP